MVLTIHKPIAQDFIEAEQAIQIMNDVIVELSPVIIDQVLFAQANASTKTRLAENEITKMVEARNMEAVNRLSGANDFGSDIHNRTLFSMETGAQYGKYVASTDLPITVVNRLSFNLVNGSATQWAQDHSARLVTGVSQNTKKGIRTVIARSIREGIPPRETAKLLVPIVGLNRQQSNGAFTFFSNLQEQTAKGEISSTTSTRLYDAYTDRLKLQRATTIARTEIVRSLNAGQQMVWEQGVQDGLIDQSSKRRWIVTPDERLDHLICAPMTGQTVGMKETFRSGIGTTAFLPPIHPMCRCTVRVLYKPAPVQRIPEKNLKPSIPTTNASEYVNNINIGEGSISPTKKDVIAGLRAIERVHDVRPGRSSLAVNVDYKKNSNVTGSYRHSQGKPLEIKVLASGQTRVLTTIHEYGHYLDHHLVPEKVGILGSFATHGISTTLSVGGKVNGLMTTIKSSKTIEKLRTYLHDINSRSWTLYALTDKELFARAYSQYIAKKSGNKQLLQELAIRQPKEPVDSWKLIYDQWDDVDFEPIMGRFDDLFRELGWLKEK